MDKGAPRKDGRITTNGNVVKSSSSSNIRDGLLAQNHDSVKTLQTIHEISKLMNTNLDLECLSIVYQLIERGIHPEKLANVIVSLQKMSK